MLSGVAVAVSAAACFGAGAVCMRRGMRGRRDDGLFTTVMVNSVVLGLGFLLVSRPQWQWTGVLAFCLSGLLGTVLGRWCSLRAVRRIGASRANAFFVSAPIFAALGGWIILREGLTLGQALGAAVVISGLALVVRSRGTARSLAVEDAGVLAAGFAGGGGTSTRSLLRWRGLPDGYVYALVAAMLLGFAFVARKFGIERYPSALAGGFFGTTTGVLVLGGAATVQGRLNRLIEDNVQRASPWYLAGGLAMSLGLIFQFTAFLSLPAWLVSLLVGTQGLWTLLWSYLFIRHDEGISKDLVYSVLLVVAGVVIIASWSG